MRGIGSASSANAFQPCLGWRSQPISLTHRRGFPPVKIDDLEYKQLVEILRPYTEKGRPTSIAFLNWFLEHIYRLDQVGAEDAICDRSNDRGIDGIYVDLNQLEVHVLQSKTKQNGTIGDKDLREFSGTLNQLRSREALAQFLEGKVDEEVKKKIKAIDLDGLLEKGFAVRGVFITNAEIDANGLDVIKGDPALLGYDRTKIVSNYVDLGVQGGIKDKFEFSLDGESLSFQAGTLARVLVLFAAAKELANLPGIDDGSLFELNVRLPLGSTKVNKAIKDSIDDVKQHVKFPLFHNGITLLSEKVVEAKGAIGIENFVVVNGAQSLKQIYNGSDKLSDDLRVLTRIIEIGGDTDLAREISTNSNNQNGIKPRDLRSNDDIQVRLKSEFEKLNFEGYEYDVKRGDTVGGNTISNELAGKLILAFDLDEPWSCHQSYKVFDEKYADIFARPSVNACRIIFLAKIMNIIQARRSEIENAPFGHYGLTSYVILNAVKKILQQDAIGASLCMDPSTAFADGKLDCVLGAINDVLTMLLIDINHEIASGALPDYKSDLKSKTHVEKFLADLVKSYQKDKARGKVDDLSARLTACGLS